MHGYSIYFLKKKWKIGNMKVETLKEEIKIIQKPRRTSYGNIRHKLKDIIIIGLCTVICVGEDFTDMEDFGEEREDFLRNFLEAATSLEFYY